jgi:hypothetical protein
VREDKKNASHVGVKNYFCARPDSNEC